MPVLRGVGGLGEGRREHRAMRLDCGQPVRGKVFLGESLDVSRSGASPVGTYGCALELVRVGGVRG